MKKIPKRAIIAASGTQTFRVVADSAKEAREKFEAGLSKLVHNDCEVTDLSDWDFESMSSEEIEED